MVELSVEAMKALQDMMDNAIKKALKERDEERESSSDEETPEDGEAPRDGKGERPRF